MNRSGLDNYQRFPPIKKGGVFYCCMCKVKLTGRKKRFCGRRCLRDFFMQTDWQRVRRVIYYRDGGICMKCGVTVDVGSFHVDHIMPISKGGEEFDLANLELSCPPCNLKKGAKLPKRNRGKAPKRK